MFSFNQDSKRNMIGNNQLGREKYLSLKAELVGQMRDAAIAGKKLPSLADIMG